VGAHCDAVYGAPGANDNGSGVAVVLQLIHDFYQKPFKHRVDFCFFDYEEPGLIGSSVYVREIDTSITVIGMINLDVEGTGSEVYAGPNEGKHHSTLMKYIRQAARKANYAYYEDEVIPETDNESFDDAGIENISISVVPPGDGKKISDLCRDPLSSREHEENYPKVLNVMHTSDDTSARVEPEALEKAYRFAIETLELFDNGER
jgi:Zn-dependent M28 family amino/carboxypeptidase